MRTKGAYSTHRPASESRQRAWNSMRVLRVFSRQDVISTAQISPANLKKYLPALLRAGYLGIARQKQNGKSQGHVIYRLMRNTGPRAPIPRTDNSGMYDPNQDVLYPFRAEAEAAQDDGKKLARSAP